MPPTSPEPGTLAPPARLVAKSKGMTPLGVAMGLFPLGILGLAFGCCAWFVWKPSCLAALSLLLTLYGLPLVCHWLHRLFFKVREGGTYLAGKGYSPWYGSHQIQLIYLAFPALETGLRLVPGLFSLWLRAWGSRIGRGVYWTPHLEVLDRGLLDVGDRVIFGHRVGLSGHIIRPTRDNLLLYVKGIRIGNGAFVGAGSYIGPGCVVEAGALIPAGSHVMPRSKVGA